MQIEERLNINNITFCYKCGAKKKNESNSLHIWEVEYECGCKIWGAIDTKTHGDKIEIYTSCKSETYPENNGNDKI